MSRAKPKLTKAGRDFLVSQLFSDSPRGIPALGADVSYRPAKQISDAGLADRETDGAGLAWYYLNKRGWAMRADLQGAAATPPLITFAEAEAVGHALHDHWAEMAGSAPLARDDMAWGDIVQFVLRKARDAVEARGA